MTPYLLWIETDIEKIRDKENNGPRDYRIRVQQRAPQSTALSKETRRWSEDIRSVEPIRHIDSKHTIPFIVPRHFDQPPFLGAPFIALFAMDRGPDELVRWGG